MAQIVPDATLPVNSTVTQQGATTAIDGGTKAGGNLFHSFREFSIPTNGEAYFNNALDIQNIFSRVTGGSISNIDGLIRANGSANLFLLNPNGIIFGPNARLNIGGSFLASTASSIRFADDTFFGTTSPQTAPLLTISVPIGLQMGRNPGNILVQGPGNNLSLNPETGTITRDNRPVGLQVAPGQTLALLGGNLTLEGGNLTAKSGRIELGSVGGDTLVTLTPMNSGMALSYPEMQNFQDISLSKAASVDVSGAGGGDVFVVGRRVTLTDGSVILALTEGAKAGGTLSVRASETVELIGISAEGQFNSSLFVSVAKEATGDGGNLIIETTRLQLVDGGQVGAGTLGAGKAGNVTVKATDVVELIGIASNGKSASSLDTSVNSGATGDGGNLTIETARLRVIDGAQIGAGTFGAGKGGNLTVKATETVEVIGTSADGGVLSGLFASAAPGATGNGGNLTIETARLRVIDGALVSVDTFGAGKGGNLTVQATDAVELIGTSSDGNFVSGLFASVRPGATGDGGNLTIETARLHAINGAQVLVATFGPGKAGNLIVKATDAVELIGTRGDSGVSSGLFASVGLGATGDGGNLTIETARLRVADGAVVSVATFGLGKGGNLIVKATDAVELIGTRADGVVSSGLAASVARGATGDGGNLTIETARLRVVDGAQVSVATFGTGKGGNLTVKATDAVELIGTSADGKISSSLRALAPSGATGDGGNLTIETARLQVVNGATVSVRNRGEGKAGNLIVDAGSILLDNSGRLTADTKAGGGRIELRSDTITLRRGSQISTNATGGESGGDVEIRTGFLQLRQGSSITTNAEGIATGTEIKGGNITIDADVLAALENSDISANSDSFFGGRVFINTQGIFGTQFGDATTPESDITATGKDSAFSGTVTINTPEVDPSSGLIELPQNFVDISGLIADSCSSARQGSSFTVTGRGGIPESPDEPLSPDAFLVDLIAIDSQVQGSRGETNNPSLASAATPDAEIVEATGWFVNEKGQVILTASAPKVTPTSPWFTPPTCPPSVR